MADQTPTTNSAPATQIKVESLRSNWDPEEILKRAQQKLNAPKKDEDGEYEEDKETLTDKDPIVKAMTLSEFDNGVLLLQALPERYRTFSVDLSRKLQKEYGCVTTSEKMMAENVAMNFIRTIEAKQRMNDYLERGTFTDIGVGYLNMLSKELGRANREYITSLQMLRMLKQPPVTVNIKTNNAFVGNNQVVQENQNVKPI